MNDSVVQLPPLPKSNPGNHKAYYVQTPYWLALQAWERMCANIVARGGPIQPPPPPDERGYGNYKQYYLALQSWERCLY